ncbi:MAG: Rrf2 family transcriptional regulator [Nitrospirae bacterium]|nr:Rrf2 family transcriptional regulator [Nitrospirota bacterium]MCL5285815.1 Rrf2 family transcriptional regulator [Nitrospirota bacterium]MDA8027818.1 Rrf2 family transcriptional regulator [Nitrospiraceae bacterium]
MLKLTKKVDYALLALNLMARNEEGGISNVRDIAALYSIPPEILAKVMQKLSKSGLIQSHNAPKGGYSLKVPAEEISVLKVLVAVEGPVGIVSCSDGTDRTCQQRDQCDIRSPLERLQNNILWFLEALSIRELGQEPAVLKGVTDGSSLFGQPLHHKG